jgi:hypothetical protein
MHGIVYREFEKDFEASNYNDFFSHCKSQPKERMSRRYPEDIPRISRRKADSYRVGISPGYL